MAEVNPVLEKVFVGCATVAISTPPLKTLYPSGVLADVGFVQDRSILPLLNARPAGTFVAVRLVTGPGPVKLS